MALVKQFARSCDYRGCSRRGSWATSTKGAIAHAKVAGFKRGLFWSAEELRTSGGVVPVRIARRFDLCSEHAAVCVPATGEVTLRPDDWGGGYTLKHIHPEDAAKLQARGQGVSHG